MLDTDGVNAFAAPGGFVHITKGLLGLMKNEAELAGVLAHEITHVTKKHTVNSIQKGDTFKVGTDEVGSSGGMTQSARDPGRAAGLQRHSRTTSSAATTRTRRTRRAWGWRTRSATPRRASSLP